MPVIWLGVILSLSSQDGNTSSSLSFKLAQFVRDFFHLPFMVGQVNKSLRKIAHIFFFSVEGILTLNALQGRKQAATEAVGLCTLLSIVDEGHKILIPGRHCNFDEIILNAVAATVAILFCSYFKKET